MKRRWSTLGKGTGFGVLVKEAQRYVPGWLPPSRDAPFGLHLPLRLSVGGFAFFVGAVGMAGALSAERVPDVRQLQWCARS